MNSQSNTNNQNSEELNAKNLADSNNIDSENINDNSNKEDSASHEPKNQELLALKAENEKLKNQNQELADKSLRIYAESQNYQRRSKEELEKSIKFASNNFISDLIPTIENFFLACENAAELTNSQIKEVKSFFDAIEMTKKELVKTLEKHMVHRIYPLQQSFDHNLHEAISQVPSNDHPEGTIINIIQAGYKIHERLIKPAMVVVTKAVD
jgi:molecular chaperone GrpE